MATIVRSAAAVAVGLLLVTGCSAGRDAAQTGSSTTVTDPSGSPTGPDRSHNVPLPSGFVPESVSAISRSTYWVLGTAPCAQNTQRGCLALARTDDGGRTFHSIAVPDATVPPAPDQGTTEVRFADDRNGWLYGGRYGDAAYATHDGGVTWRHVTLPGPVRSLEAGRDTAWAVVAGGTTYSLHRAAVDKDDWQPVRLPVTLKAPGPHLAVAGGDVVVLDNSDETPGVLLRSTDKAHFSVERTGCTTGLGGSLSALDSALWMVCPTGMQAGLWRSVNGGEDFIRAKHPPIPNSTVIGAIGPDAAVIAIAGTLHRTTDRGATWSAITVPGQHAEGVWHSIRFVDSQTGFAVRSQPQPGLWRTDDGGLSWQPVRF
jgi:hypothetical protein